MKQQEMIVLGLAGLAVYMIMQATKKGGGTTTAGGLDKFVNEVFSAGGTPFKNGWRYYDNGTAIDPQGNYYQNGQLVWSAPK
jgi:hypothetical protein